MSRLTINIVISFSDDDSLDNITEVIKKVSSYVTGYSLNNFCKSILLCDLVSSRFVQGTSKTHWFPFSLTIAAILCKILTAIY